MAQRQELDERRTAEVSADADALMLQFRRSEGRWAELAVLIDVSSSMALWRGEAEELLHVLTRLGVFRDVLAWSFDSDEAEPRFRPHPRWARTGQGRASSAASLAGPGERRAFLVISDGVGEAWRDGGMMHALGQLAARSHVSLVNPLPHRMWHRTGIPTEPMFQRTTGIKDRLAVRYSWSPEGPAESGRWLAVWHLDPDELGAWARLLAGTSNREKPGESLEIRQPARHEIGPRHEQDTGSAAERVARFRASASSGAFRLATRLAAVPLSLPVMRMIQAEVLPGEGPERLAEILLSGLLVRRSPPLPREDPDRVIYDFARGIREQLLAALTRTEAFASLNVVARAPDSVAGIFGGSLDFRLIAERDTDAPPLPEQARYFARTAVTVLQGLGPAFGDVAGRITARLDQGTTSVFTAIQDRDLEELGSTVTIVQVDGPGRQEGDGATLADSLADRIEADLRVRPDLLVGCENLVAAATSSEVARSAAFFGRLLNRFRLAPDRIILAPAPVGWRSWGAFDYPRAVAGRNATAALAQALGCPAHGADTWWQTDLAGRALSLTVLDSTQVTASTRLGALGARQLSWLSGQRGSPGPHESARVVIMHHDPASRLLEASAFYAAMPDQDLVLHGWGPSASATSLASAYTSAPAVPEPEAGYIVHKVAGDLVAIRGRSRQMPPQPASGRATTSSIFLAFHQPPAAPESPRGEYLETAWVGQIVDPRTVFGVGAWVPDGEQR